MGCNQWAVSVAGLRTMASGVRQHWSELGLLLLLMLALGLALRVSMSA
jgi:hypothetical protein